MWSDVIEKNRKYHLHIELTSKCNASCPHCPRYLRGSMLKNPAVKLGELSIDNVREWVPEDIVKNIGSMNVCGNFGDPSMCRDMVEICEYFMETNPAIEMRIRTNGGGRDDSFWTALGNVSKKFGGKMITLFSVDGLEDTNHLYRRNVVWDKLMENINSYVKSGGIAGWEYLIFKHNEHQIEDAKKLRLKLGMDFITFKQPIGFEDFHERKTRPLPVYNKKGELDYLLEPSEHFKNSEYPYEKNMDDIPKMLKVDNSYCNFNPNKIDYDRYKEIENTEIKCQAVHPNNEIEIYIDSNGFVRPCCHIGVETDRYVDLDEGRHARDILSPDFLFNLNTNSLKNILELFDIRIEGTWNKTHQQGRCIKCSKQCGKSSETGLDRLFAGELNTNNSDYYDDGVGKNISEKTEKSIL